MLDVAVDKVRDLAAGEYQSALLYAAISGLIISDLVPTPASAIAYAVSRKQQSNTNQQARQKVASVYNMAVPAWWAVVFAAVHFNKGDFNEKVKLAALLIGGGAAVGIMFNRHITAYLPKIDNK